MSKSHDQRGRVQKLSLVDLYLTHCNYSNSADQFTEQIFKFNSIQYCLETKPSFFIVVVYAFVRT